MDFQGQALAEQLSLLGVVVSALVAFIVGFMHNDFNQLALVYGSGVGIVLLVILPDHPWWPFSRLFNRHPIKWLPPLQTQADAPAEESSAKEASLLNKVLSMLGLGSKPPSKIKKLKDRAAKASADKKK